MQRISYINSNNTQLVNDYDLDQIASFLTKRQSGVMYTNISTKPEFAYSGGVLQPGKAVIQAIRVSSTPIANKKIAIIFESDTTINIPQVVGNKIYIEINNSLLQDQTQIIDIPPSNDFALGLNIAEIKSTPSYPSHPNYIPLWEITAGPILVDVRIPLIISSKYLDLSDYNGDINADEITVNNIEADTINVNVITANELILPSGNVQNQIDNLSASNGGVVLPAGENLLNNDVIFIESAIGITDASSNLNIGSSASNRRIAIRLIGSGVPGRIIGINVGQNGSSSFDLNLRIETDNAGAPSGTLFDANGISTLTPTDIPASKGYRPMFLNGNITIPKGQTVWVVLFQGAYGSEAFNASNYYFVGYNSLPTTTRFERIRNGTVWSNTTNKSVYCNSKLFEGWDISTSNFINTFSTATEETQPFGIFFKPNGLSAYIIGSNREIFQYDLGIAWDISTAVDSGNSFDTSTQTTAGNTRGLSFSGDGLKCYVSGMTNQEVYEYDLGTARDASTISYSGNSLDVSSEITSVAGINISIDGTFLFSLDNSSNIIYKYTLSTPFDLSTGSYSSDNFAGTVVNSTGFFLRDDGLKLYIVGSTFGPSNKIREYTLSTAFDLSSAVYSGIELTDGGPEQRRGIYFRNDGIKLYISSNIGNILEYTLDYDLNIVISDNLMLDKLFSKCDSGYKEKSDWIGFASSTVSSGSNCIAKSSIIKDGFSGLEIGKYYYPGVAGAITDTATNSDNYSTPNLGVSVLENIIDMNKIKPTYYGGTLLNLSSTSGVTNSTAVYMTRGGQVNFRVLASNDGSFNNATYGKIQTSLDGINYTDLFSLGNVAAENATKDKYLQFEIPSKTYYRFEVFIQPAGAGGSTVTELSRAFF